MMWRCLAQTLELQIQKLEDNFALDGKTREQLKINEDHQSSMFAAFTQADFERLAFAERTSKRIQGLLFVLSMWVYNE